MLTTSAALAKKLAYAIEEKGLSQVEIAKRCSVSKQAVQGWKKTGRIAKQHMLVLAEMSGLPLDWWLDSSQLTYTATQDAPAPAPVVKQVPPPYGNPPWPFRSITPAQYGALSEHQRSMIEGFILAQQPEPSLDKSDPDARAA